MNMFLVVYYGARNLNYKGFNKKTLFQLPARRSKAT